VNCPLPDACLSAERGAVRIVYDAQPFAGSRNHMCGTGACLCGYACLRAVTHMQARRQVSPVFHKPPA